MMRPLLLWHSALKQVDALNEPMTLADTIPARLLAHAQDRPEQAAYYTLQGGQQQATSWKTFSQQMQRAACAMLSLGISRGRCLAAVGNPSPEWTTFSIAAMSIGSAYAGLYPNTDSDDLREIVYHAECPIAFVESKEIWEKLNVHRDKLPLLQQIVILNKEDAAAIDDPFTIAWEDFLKLGEHISPSDFDRRISKLQPEQIATYTYKNDPDRGPQGAMLSHDNLTWTASVLAELLEAGPSDQGFSVLPMAHMTEQLFSLHLPIIAGYPITYARSLESFLEDLKSTQPTILFAVPQLWTLLQEHIKLRLNTQASGWVAWAAAKGIQTTSDLMKGQQPGLLARWQKQFGQRFLQPLLQQMGFSRIKYCFSGLQPLDPEVIISLGALQLPLFETFGEDETSGLATLNLPGATTTGSPGQPLPGVEMQFDEEGHLQLKGPNIFLGYYKDNQSTNKALKYGWYTTTLKGHIDAKGFLIQE